MPDDALTRVRGLCRAPPDTSERLSHGAPSGLDFLGVPTQDPERAPQQRA